MPLFLAAFFLSTLLLPSALATTRQQVYLAGAVHSFGSYVATQALSFTIQAPGTQELGTITIDGLYNGEYPWIMRVYTENAEYTGVAGSIRRVSPAGLVSADGQYVIPLEVHSPNFGTDVWRRVPDLLESPYIPYTPSDDPRDESLVTDCILMGIDPRHAPWVAGPDRQLFTADDNVLGDTTLQTPFTVTLRARIDPTAVHGQYTTFLYLEIVPAP